MLYTLFCVGFWAVIFSFIFYRFVSAFNQGINYLQRLHQIPCAKCAYFTGDYRLKCPINPQSALSEAAINCRDFQCQSNCNFSNLQTSNKINDSKLYLKKSCQK